MKEVQVLSWCDYPDCADTAREQGMNGQETVNVQVWLYVPGKGRKPNPLQIEVCEDCLAQMRALHAVFAKADQGVESK